MTKIRATLVRAGIKWLDGGGEDECMVLTPYPADLRALADAIDAHPGGCDESLSRLADKLRACGLGDVVTNNSTRFVAVMGSELDSGPPDGKCVIELQELCLCATAGFDVDYDCSGDNLVDLKLPRPRR